MKRSPCQPPSRRRHGMMLMITLWFVVLMMTIAYSLTQEMQIGMRMTSTARKSVQAQALARAGLAKAVTDLRNDRFVIMAGGGFVPDTRESIWAQTDDKTDIELGDGHYSVRVLDENRKIDINFMTRDTAPALALILTEACELNEDDARLISECVADFIDADLEPMDPEGKNEIDFYTEFGQSRFGDQLPRDWSFRPKNDYMMNIEELLEIPGITPTLLYGHPDEVPIDPIERVDAGDDDSPALCDYVMAGSAKGVNLNTANQYVLAGIIHAGSRGTVDAMSIAAEVIDQRDQLIGMSDEDSPGFSNYTQVTDAGVPSDVIAAMRQAFQLRFNSTEFTIVSQGRWQGMRRTLGARVNVELERFVIDPEVDESLGSRDDAADGKLDDDDVLIDPAVRVFRQWDF